MNTKRLRFTLCLLVGALLGVCLAGCKQTVVIEDGKACCQCKECKCCDSCCGKCCKAKDAK